MQKIINILEMLPKTLILMLIRLKSNKGNRMKIENQIKNKSNYLGHKIIKTNLIINIIPIKQKNTCNNFNKATNHKLKKVKLIKQIKYTNMV